MELTVAKESNKFAGGVLFVLIIKERHCYSHFLLPNPILYVYTRDGTKDLVNVRQGLYHLQPPKPHPKLLLCGSL